jgi:tetratricopeptide (TPR) repeat protein
MNASGKRAYSLIMVRAHRLLAALLALLLVPVPATATCGGGGGGGAGGALAGGMGDAPQVYQVPWLLLRGDLRPPGKLRVYWFPTSPTEARASALQNSRSLTLAAGRCVAMGIIPPDRADAYSAFRVEPGSGPLVVLTGAGGEELGRVLPPSPGKEPRLGEIEKLVQAQLKAREMEIEASLDQATSKEKAGDKDAAIGLYEAVWGERCLDPSAGRKAAKSLKRLGHPVDAKEEARLELLPNADAEIGAVIQARLEAGAAAEVARDYPRAGALYREAVALDPHDPVALRYLGEYERHHSGDWHAATRAFEAVLAGPADPISRAVALHGIGKMTIHADRFAEGLALIEQSVATWPLPLAFRNLAVFWNSEGQMVKARGYAEQALALAPEDPYNIVFLAVFRAEDGERADALRIAARYGDLLEASYNQAVIHALAGDKSGALALLRRHFYEYEGTDAVRAKEMREAREDIGFLDLRKDPEFIALTRLAESPEHRWSGPR